MHRCLHIAEILHEICQHISASDLDTNGMPAVPSCHATATLAALARTCKTIQSPALDALWGDLDYFMRLVQCLPRDLWKVHEVPPTAPHLTQPESPIVFQRAMDMSDWDIFNKYAPRVRSLGGLAYDNNPYKVTTTVSSEVLQVLSCPPTSSPLLPNLRAITWNGLPVDHIPLFRHFLTTKVTRLIIRLDSETLDAYSYSTLSLVGIICPKLRNFAIGRAKHAPRETGRSITIVSRTLCRLQHLKSVMVNIINGEAIIHLARLPALASASFALDISFNAASISSQLPATPFPRLSLLKMQAPVLSSMDSLLKTMKISPHLVDVSFDGDTPAARVAAFFVTLCSSCSPDSLFQLVIQENTRTLHDDIQNPSTCLLKIDQLRPLFQFTRLRSLRLELFSTFSINDAGIEELARAWPALTALHLNKAAGWEAPSQITFQGLAALLQHCPKLSTLSIDVDFRSLEALPVPRACPCNGLSNEHIKEVSLGNSRLDKPVVVAVFVSAVLPNLMKVNAWATRWADRRLEGVRQNYKAKWDNFNQLLPVIAATRAQGKGCSHAPRPSVR
ncbi:hypothetical protein BV22DRAFT_1006684 [Leucogyrophana mollusca]|uniref:Uncharacterized protein n=1 Tax=Leucogyrophana mollusca TaxID=85980 RepID=A0ACB8BPP1_9AGAM|nr:hypothetical protein BV22DRAFT_1006684 [Leucogyrophana mollusca]